MGTDVRDALPKIGGFVHTDDNVTNWNILSRAKCDRSERDFVPIYIENSGMGKKTDKPLTGYEKEVIRRTKGARSSLDCTQEVMADKLGIPRVTYAKYETIRIMDTELMPKFCGLAGISIDFLLTGKEHPLVEAYQAAAPDDKRLAEKVLGVKKPEALPKKHQAA